VVGRITLGEASIAFRDTLHALAAESNSGILLNLSEVSNIDSSGIGELVSGFTTARTQGRTVKLVALSRRVEDLLKMTGVYRIFEIHQDEARALRSFNPPV
jgi:anti-sigma B factor antagonist